MLLSNSSQNFKNTTTPTKYDWFCFGKMTSLNIDMLSKIELKVYRGWESNPQLIVCWSDAISTERWT